MVSSGDARQRDESELIARIAAGSEKAFVMLVGRYQNRFYSVARRVLGDDGEAEDAVQTTFLRIFRHAADYRDEWRTSTWLYRILANVCIDQWRKRRRLGDVTEPTDVPARHKDTLVVEAIKSNQFAFPPVMVLTSGLTFPSMAVSPICGKKLACATPISALAPIISMPYLARVPRRFRAMAVFKAVCPPRVGSS